MEDLKAVVLNPELTPFEQLCTLMEILRSPRGCRWDRAQTHRSLIPYLIEESYEVIEAIEEDDRQMLREELGDLLLQVVFHAQVARDEESFDINDVCRSIVTKLINRHPHVFGEKKDLDPDQVRDQWEHIKTKSGEKKSVLDGLPRQMPALTTAFRLGEKAAGVGFDWPDASGALDKVREELQELEAVLSARTPDRNERLSEELGDMLFAVASMARLSGIDPEASLRAALNKFRNRFTRMEAEIFSDRGRFDAYSLDEMEAIWQRLKLE